MDKLFDDFLNEKRYLNGVSKKPLVWYTYSFRQYKKHCTEPPAKQTLNQFVIGMRKRGLSTAAINDYIRGINVFLSWLFENGHIPEHLKVKKVKEEQTIIETFTDKQLEAIVDFKPKNDFDLRLHTLLLAAIDTGCRVEELLTLTRDNVDLDSLVIKVTGKGKKERIVPISIELKKAFFKLLRKHKSELVFCAHRGTL